MSDKNNTEIQKPIFADDAEEHTKYKDITNLKGYAKQKALRWQESLLKFTKDNPDDWVECRICGMRCSFLTGPHLPNAHGLSMSEYKDMFPDAEVISKSRAIQLSERMKGDKNISAGHGGRCSPFSEKFSGYDGLSDEEKKERIEALQSSANETMNKNDNNCTKNSYYLKRGLSEFEAKEALSKRQRTFTLEKCIQDHGEEEGLKVWQARQDKWMASLDAKTDEEKREINLKKVENASGSISKAEQEIFDYLKERIPNLQKQIQIKKLNGKGNFMYDFGVGKKIIEYNGDYWHANPSIYDEKFFNKTNKKTAQQIWDKDKEKRLSALDAGYEIYVLWESDYNQNKLVSLQKCINYLTT